MEVLILNGNPNPGESRLDEFLNRLAGTGKPGIDWKILALRDLDLKYCTGCWKCWVKNPGKCFIDDDIKKVLQAYMNANLVIFASPLIMGFTSALLKKANDRLLPLLLPYAKTFNGEFHHWKRYPLYPRTALIMEPEHDTDEKDLAITSEIYRRNAINLKTSLLFSTTINQPVENVLHQINHI